MGDASTIANELRLAHGCITDAKLLAETGSRNAAYLSEQALEQVIRAFATSEGMHIERSDAHQLDKVVRRFPAVHAEKRRSITGLAGGLRDHVQIHDALGPNSANSQSGKTGYGH
jgi:hypothetical protein